MRKVLVGMLMSFLFLVLASNNSYAEMCGCKDKMGKGMHEEGMHMRGMEHHGMCMMMAKHRIWKHLKGLGLDEKQRAAIREIESSVMKDTIKKGADVKIARMELKEILHKDPVDMQAVEAKVKEIGSLVMDIHLSHIKAMVDIKAQLTPEQKEKFKENLKKHWGHEHQKMESCGCGKEKTSHHEKKKEKHPDNEQMQH